MKKILTCAIAVIMVAALFVPAFTVPASAADGELLIKVNWLTDNFISVNQGTSVCQDFKEKYDLSKCTDDLFFPSKKEGCSSDVWKSDLFYIEETGYYVTDDTKYTIYFEVAAAHNNKYSGVPFLHENTEYDSLIMLAGSFSDDGDVDDPSGNPWTEFCYAYDYAKVDNAIGEGYTGEKDLMYLHPALATETFEADNCTGSPVTEFKFCTLKIEIDGLDVTTWYLDADRKWNKCDSLGSEVTYQAPYGSEIILGSYTRNEQRHNLIRGLRLVQGTGLTYDQILTAKQTTEPKPPRPEIPETQAPETQAPETKAPETKAPETKAPETQAPGTQAPATEAPKEEKKGCGDFAALLPVVAVAATGTVVFRRKRK
jgi:hypothetical protein